MYTIDPLTGAFEMDRGDFADPRFTITDSSGNPLDISAATFKLTVKASLEDPIGSAIFQISGASFSIINGPGGIVDALITETLTQAMAGDYVYDLEMTLAGKTRTLVQAQLFRVLKDVGDIGSPPSPPSVVAPFPGDIQVMGGQIYIKDTGTGPNAGKYWKLVVQDSVFDVQGPSTTVPF